MTRAQELKVSKRVLLAELREVGLVGLACNVQTHTPSGAPSNLRSCARRRKEARRLLDVAIAAVKGAR